MDGNSSNPSHLGKENPVEGNVSSPSHLSKEIPTDGKNNELYQQTRQPIPFEKVVEPSIPPLSKCWANQVDEEDSQDSSLEIQANVKDQEKTKE